MTPNDDTSSEKVTEEALAKAERKLQFEADKRVQDAAIEVGTSTEPKKDSGAAKPKTDPAV